jgi:glycosyltransferase involved in cell wall biosynthesis
MRVGIWATAETPEGRHTVAVPASALAGMQAMVVARPEDALPAGARRLSVYRWPVAMAVLIGIGRCASTIAHISIRLDSLLTSWPNLFWEHGLALLRSLLAHRRRVSAGLLLASLLPILLLVWIGCLISFPLAGLVRGLAAPFLWCAHAAHHLGHHALLRADSAAVVARAGCAVWLVPALECDFPYPPGVPVVVVDAGSGPAEVLTLRREQARRAQARLVPAFPTAAELPALWQQPAQTEVTCNAIRPASGPLRVHLFLPQAYQGGVWEATRTLVHALHAVAQRRCTLELTLAVPVDQRVTGLDATVRIERLVMPVQPGGREPVCVPFSPTMPEADAWFALVDRFPAVVEPVRPLGLIVHDVIQKYVPEAFPMRFHTHDWPIIRRTIARASLVITTSEVTRQDVVAEYGLAEHTVRLVPVACEPARRFEGRMPQRVEVPDGCILNPCNATPHKGAAVMLRAYADLRRRGPVPPLVLCGAETDRFDPASKVPPTPYWLQIRRLVRSLDLEVGREVFFLGFVTDEQLLDLFTRCSVVVNAARFDNGTYSLIEAHYFAKPTVCSRYPAAQWLYDRFAVPVRYFAVEDAADLASQLATALAAPAIDRAAARQALADPRHSYERYAEQVYDALVALARQGRGRSSQAA